MRFLISGVTEAECKRRWRLIRDRYAKESKGAKGKSGAGREDAADMGAIQVPRILGWANSPQKVGTNIGPHTSNHEHVCDCND